MSESIGEGKFGGGSEETTEEMIDRMMSGFMGSPPVEAPSPPTTATPSLLDGISLRMKIASGLFSVVVAAYVATSLVGSTSVFSLSAGVSNPNEYAGYVEEFASQKKEHTSLFDMLGLGNDVRESASVSSLKKLQEDLASLSGGTLIPSSEGQEVAALPESSASALSQMHGMVPAGSLSRSDMDVIESRVQGERRATITEVFGEEVGTSLAESWVPYDEAGVGVYVSWDAGSPAYGTESVPGHAYFWIEYGDAYPGVPAISYISSAGEKPTWSCAGLRFGGYVAQGAHDNGHIKTWMSFTPLQRKAVIQACAWTMGVQFS